MYTLESVNSVANFITAYEESQLNGDSHFLICSVFFVSKGNLFDVYFSNNILILDGYVKECFMIILLFLFNSFCLIR